MTTLRTPTAIAVSHAIRRAAVRATLAPSVHNTQPWSFRLCADTLELHLDPSRRLRLLDPFGRQQMISCGCALFNARASLAASGFDVDVARIPDPAQPALFARVTVRGRNSERDPIAALDRAIPTRQTNRRPFDDDAVPDAVVAALVAAAAAEQVTVLHLDRPIQQRAVARLTQLADAVENADPAYRAELRAWTTDDPRRLDGVPSSAVPHVTGAAEAELPIRDFDTRGAGRLPERTGAASGQCLLLLGSSADDRLAWLRSGEGLERVLLEIARRGYAVSPFTQPVEVAQTNARLRAELDLRINPHLLLRVGRAPRTPAVRRRRLADMITDDARSS